MIDRDRLATLHRDEEARFTDLHPRSAAYAKDADGPLLAGVPMPWMTRWPGSFPLTFDTAVGARLTDVDGLEYVDLCLGDTGAMTGHALPQVADAIAERARTGITTMLPSTDSTWAAEELARRFGVPSWQFALSATDANRFVLRYARHLTGRPEDRRLRLVLPRHGRRDLRRPRRRAGRRPPRQHGSAGRRGHHHGGAPVQRRRRPRPPARRGRRGLPAHRARAHQHRHRAARAGLPDAVREITRRHGVLLDHRRDPHPLRRARRLHRRLGPGPRLRGGRQGDRRWRPRRGVRHDPGGRRRADGSDGAPEIDVAGVGGTLTGNALSLAAVRATLSSCLRQEEFDSPSPSPNASPRGSRT